MHFSSVVICVTIAYRGLASAQQGDGDVSLDRRDLEARNLMFLKSRPVAPGPDLIQDIFRAMSAMPGPQLSMAPMLGGASLRPKVQLLRPQRSAGQRKSQSSNSNPWQPRISETLLANPNGYTVTTTVNVKPNEPKPAALSAAALRLPSFAAIKIPLRQPRLLFGAPTGRKQANSLKVELARAKALKPMMLRILAAKRKAIALQILNKQRLHKQKVPAKAALASALKAKLKELAPTSKANKKNRGPTSHEADIHKDDSKSKHKNKKKSRDEKDANEHSVSKSKKGSSEKVDDQKSESNSTLSDTKESKKSETSSRKEDKEHDHAVETREAEVDADPKAEAEPEAELLDDPAVWS